MTAPQRLVENGIRQYGRFAERVRDTNPVDAHRGLSGLWRRFRLKEWIGFARILHREMSGVFERMKTRF